MGAGSEPGGVRLTMRTRPVVKATAAGRLASAAVIATLAVIGGAMAPSTSVDAAPGGPEWLQIVNRYRASAGISPVTENAEASAGALKHAQYLVVNRATGHEEYPKYKGFSKEGLRAGMTGNVAIGYGRNLPSPREIVESLLTAPFHGLAILNPSYSSFGFGSTGGKSYWAASMPVFWDNYQEESDTEIAERVEPDWDGAVDRVLAKFPKLRGGGYEATGTADRIVITMGGRRFVVTPEEVRELGPDEIAALVNPNQPKVPDIYVWPGNGSSVPLTRYAGNEFPNPIAGCPGFTPRAGLPLLVLGPSIEFSSVVARESGGQPLTLCVLTAQTYTSKDQGDMEFVRQLLRNGAIILPKSPLTPGRTYEVTADVVGGPKLNWSFSISTTSAIGLPPEHPMAGEPTPGVAYQLQSQVKSPAKKTTKKPVSKRN
jgi:uncharacterized protein YkwD